MAYFRLHIHIQRCFYNLGNQGRDPKNINWTDKLLDTGHLREKEYGQGTGLPRFW